MEAVGGSILSACFDGVIERLKSIDWLKYLDQGHVRDQFNKWEKMLRRIYVVLDDAEEMQPTSRLVDIWLTDLRCLAYDLEDVLDEITTEVQHCNSLDEDDKIRPSKVRKIISSFSAAVNPRAFRFNVEMISKIEMITAKLDEILKEKDDLDFQQSNRKISQTSERLPSTSLVSEMKVYGREHDKEAILELLETADVAVIPIVGMAGVGKTTLAQLIYNDKLLQFDFKAWVSVGEDFDIFRITKTVLGSNGFDNNLNSLQVKLKEKLSGKKFLVVLDDVWSENYEKWSLFCGPFEAGALGSRIIITSRSREVALLTAGNGTIHYLKELSFDACLSVFWQHALGAMNFDRHLDVKPIGEEIVRRCKGLPLAAKVLGGLLRGKSSINAWNKVLKSEIWDLPESKSNILPALRLSYLYLPPHLKRCLAYCSIFPKDYKFDKNELVLLWMAEGFICPQKNSKQREELGHEYFNYLLSRSFFQQSNVNKSRYVMHDLINDLAHFVSRDTCFHLVDNELEAKHSFAYIRYSSFVRRYYNIYRRFECFYMMSKLRTFLSLQHSDYDRSYLSKKVLFNLLPNLKSLRVLSLTNYYFIELPSCVGELKHLRYLELSCTGITRLPESIGLLYNLETLRLRACFRLTELPKSMCKLTKLLYLDISDTNSLKVMPQRIGNLTSLRMLSKFIIGEGSDGLKISELRKLSQLAGKLKIEGLHSVRVIKHENLLKEKHELLDLHLKWDYVHVEDPFQDEQILKSLEPCQTLSSLSIAKFSGTRFPSWVGDPIFVKMVKLQLEFCENIRSLPPLGRLPSLKELIIQGLNAVELIGGDFYETESSFPCLETLQIRGMLEWKNWSWNHNLSADSVEMFHKLVKLKIEDCPKFIGKFPSFLPSIEELEISGCEQLTSLPRVLPSLQKLSINACQGAILSNLQSFPSLTELKMERMKGLTSLNNDFVSTMRALRKLAISQCNELKYLWTWGNNLDCLPNLTTLNITSCKELVSLANGEDRLLPLNLQSLEFSNCQLLKQLPNGLNNLKSLKSVVIYYCCNLEVNCSSQFPYLETLEVRRCKSVSFSPNDKSADSLKILRVGKGAKVLLGSLHYGFSHLTQLKIFGCYELDSFPGRPIPDLPTLKSLTIARCNRLKSLSTHMQSLCSLQYLNVWNCDSFESFPESGLQIPSLVSFKLNGCPNLKDLPNQMQNHTSLQCLYIRGAQIVSLEGFVAPNLTELVISDCKKLSQPMAEWGLNRLTFLKKLTIAFNTEMVVFPDSEGLLLPTSLIYLIISDFENMKAVSRGIGNLGSLRELVIARCGRLECFPAECLAVTVECVEIYQCPLLQDWCSKEHGEYGPIISYSS